MRYKGQIRCNQTADGAEIVSSAFSEELELTVGVDDRGRVHTTYDGELWTWRVASGFYTNVEYDTNSAGSMFIIFGPSGVRSTSPDGISWTRRWGVLERRGAT